MNRWEDMKTKMDGWMRGGFDEPDGRMNGTAKQR
jgi:hypothetical protein